VGLKPTGKPTPAVILAGVNAERSIGTSCKPGGRLRCLKAGRLLRVLVLVQLYRYSFSTGTQYYCTAERSPPRCTTSCGALRESQSQLYYYCSTAGCSSLPVRTFSYAQAVQAASGRTAVEREGRVLVGDPIATYLRGLLRTVF
jgi:hypothetical protein